MKHPKNKQERKIIRKKKNKALYNKIINAFGYETPIWYKCGVPKRYYYQSKYWKNQANRAVRRSKYKPEQYKKIYPYTWKIW